MLVFKNVSLNLQKSYVKLPYNIQFDASESPLSNGENRSFLSCIYQKLFKKYPPAFFFRMGSNYESIYCFAQNPQFNFTQMYGKIDDLKVFARASTDLEFFDLASSKNITT